MDRKKLYAFISEHPDLKERIKEVEGKNFTNVKTDHLDAFVTTYKNMANKSVTLSSTNNVEAILDRLITILYKKRVIIKKEADFILFG